MPFNNQRNSRDDKSKRQRSSSEGFKPKSNFDKKSSNSRGDSFGKSPFSKERSEDKKSFGRPSRFSKEGSDTKKPFERTSKFSKDNTGGERKSFDKNSRFSKDGSGERKSFDRNSSFSNEGNRERKSFDRNSRFSKDSNGERKSFDRNSSFSKDNNGERKSFDRNSRFSKDSNGERKSFDRNSSFSNDGNRERKSFDRNSSFSNDGNRERKSFDRNSKFSKDSNGERRPFDRNSKFSKDGNSERKSFDKRSSATPEYIEQRQNNDFKYSANRKFRPANKPANKHVEDDGLIRLNRYISNSGICSRRKADELIDAGVISVNGEVVTELGTRIDPAKDEIRYNNERLKREKMVYVLLNKPKDYITTTDDPQERRTVMQLVAKATKERIYPVGRLDRNTTGLLLLTNDGSLADKLSHPRNGITKIYQVELNKGLAQGDFNKIQFGLELEDGFIKPDDISYVAGASKNEVGIQIHSGKNRIVRRIFESLGYEVVKLDRVVYANLTKKDLPRGRWRYLEEKELIQLKHLIK